LRTGILRIYRLHTVSPLGQVRAHGAFKRHARRVDVEQNGVRGDLW
jgi:hypothetical protein